MDETVSASKLIRGVLDNYKTCCYCWLLATAFSHTLARMVPSCANLRWMHLILDGPIEGCRGNVCA
eukprot:COSAG02_NODE_42353_length_385_cov_0.888112_1_plen_65_part_10